MYRGWRKFFGDKPLGDIAFAFLQGVGKGIIVKEEGIWLFRYDQEGKRMSLYADLQPSLVYLEKMPRKTS